LLQSSVTKRLSIPFLLIAVLLCRAQAVPTLPCTIPDLATLLKEVTTHQHELDEIRDNYTFHQTTRTDGLDATGAVQKSTNVEREVFFVNGHRIARLVKRDGVELNQSQRRAEETRVKQLIEKQIKSAPGTRGGGGVRLISEILKVAKISNPRRISLKGRDTLVFDFVGDPSANAHGMEQNAAKKTAGTIWIDETDRQVARLEVRFDDNFRIGGGLVASIQKGTLMEMEQSPVGDGLWMLSSNEQHLAGRIAFKSFRQNIHVRNFDFKRFDVEAHQQIHPPTQKAQ
jgi:hypothetical protein